MITWDNYEEYMMMHADGELSPAEEQALMSFVYEHPELANELAAFSMSKMIPDTAMVYADKKSLLQKEPARVIAFPYWQRYAVAAGVAALLFVAGVKTMYNDDSAPVVAINEKPATIQPTVAVNNSTQDDTKGIQEVIEKAESKGQKSIAAIVSPQHTTTLPAQKTTRIKQATAKQKTSHPKPVPTATAAVAVVKENIERVPAEYIGLAAMNTTENFSPNIVTNVPPVAIYISEEQGNKSFLDKLPIDDLKKKGMENVATAMASGYDKVNALRQSINEASISVKVQKRKLILSF